jgi:hypothetical protein
VRGRRDRDVSFTQQRIRQLRLELHRFRLPLAPKIENLDADADDDQQSGDDSDDSQGGRTVA